MSQYTPPNASSGQQSSYDGSGGYERHSRYDQSSGYEQSGGYGQQSQTGGYGSGRQAVPISEMTVSQPTLRRVTIERPDQPVPIGPDDYVLDSFFDARYNIWEALVLVQPGEEETEEGDDEEEEEEE